MRNLQENIIRHTQGGRSRQQKEIYVFLNEIYTLHTVRSKFLCKYSPICAVTNCAQRKTKIYFWSRPKSIRHQSWRWRKKHAHALALYKYLWSHTPGNLVFGFRLLWKGTYLFLVVASRFINMVLWIWKEAVALF